MSSSALNGFEFKLVGGPGFEPGASRSRNLRGFVHWERFRGLWVHFEHPLGDFRAVSSTKLAWITTWTTTRHPDGPSEP